MPDPNSPSWNDRFEYHLGQALIAAGGNVTVNETNTPSWHFRVETILKDIAAALQNGGGGGSGNATSIQGVPIGVPVTVPSLPFYSGSSIVWNPIPPDFGSLTNFEGTGIPNRLGEGDWELIDPATLNDATSIHGNPLDEPTLNRSVPIFNSATARFNMIPIPANLVVTGDIGQTIQPYDVDLVALANLGNGIPRRNSEGNWTALDPNSLGGSGGIPTPSNNDYYTYLASLTPNVLVGLEDWASNIIFDRNGNDVGFYRGDFAQQQQSLLSDPNARSMFFRNGGGLINSYSPVSRNAFTLVCRFEAEPTATGSFFGFGNTEDLTTTPLAYDRSVFLWGNIISVYGFAGSAVYVDGTTNVRDGNPHTLAVRFNNSGVSVFLDGNLEASTNTNITADYAGFWRIAHSTILGARSGQAAGFANGLNIAGVAIFERSLTDTEIANIHTNA